MGHTDTQLVSRLRILEIFSHVSTHRLTFIEGDKHWTTTPKNMYLEFPTRSYANARAQLARLTRKLKGSLTLAIGKCLWFSVKIKFLSIVPFFTLKLPRPEYYMAVKSVFDIKCFKDVKCKIWGRTFSFTLRYIKIRKHFLKYPPPVCQQKLLLDYVLPYFTHYMEVACWHKGVKMFSSPKTQGLSPQNAFSTK